MKIQDPCADSLDTNIVTLKPPVKTENKTSNITVKFINFPTVPLKTQNEQLVFNKSWQFKVDVPFKGVGVLVLQAKYPPGKLVAVFVGEFLKIGIYFVYIIIWQYIVVNKLFFPPRTMPFMRKPWGHLWPMDRLIFVDRLPPSSGLSNCTRRRIAKESDSCQS